jgi:hypothetical protein
MTKPPLPPLVWRLQAKAKDGQLVTIGKYRTREEADIDQARYTKEGYFRDITLQELPPPAPKPAQP